MTRLIALILMMLMVNGTVAYAGFEFMPSTQRSVVKQPVQVATPQPIAPQMHNNMIGHPAAPVMRAPLNQPAPYYAPQVMAPVTPSIAPPPAPTVQPRHVVNAPKTSSLYIDPYPLRSQKNSKMMPSAQSVAQGMVEKSGRLNPVQLGAGMTTGAKAQYMAAYSASQKLPTPRAPALNGSFGRVNNLTPIPGGEPAPLPSIEAAYSNRNITAQHIPVHYANAVGFGRDLPLELALSQVIPKGFSYNLGNVNTDGVVSWEGGEPWNVVLNNMLHTKGMIADIRNNQVIIQPLARL